MCLRLALGPQWTGQNRSLVGTSKPASMTSWTYNADLGAHRGLGARPSAVLRLMLSEGLPMGLAGLAIGLGGAFVAARASIPCTTRRTPWMPSLSSLRAGPAGECCGRDVRSDAPGVVDGRGISTTGVSRHSCFAFERRWASRPALRHLQGGNDLAGDEPIPTMTTTDSRWWSPWREIDGANILHVDLAPAPDREARAFALLDDEERQRWHRFLVQRSRRQFALCRAALRINLAERLGCSNRQLSFGYLEHGKPFAKVNGRCARVGFNVSHSGRHGLIAFAEHDGLGVDLEERVSWCDLDRLGRSVYGPAERRALATAEGWRKVHLFFRLWSMKEALLKALGCGFSLNPSGFEVPEPMLHGVRSSVLQFRHAPAHAWRLLDLGESRFAAAIAYRVPGAVPATVLASRTGARPPCPETCESALAATQQAEHSRLLLPRRIPGLGP